MKRILLIFISLFSQSCMSVPDDTFVREVLISSKKEKIFINTLNWGLTDDNQMTAVSSDINKLQQRIDTVNIVMGLEPFIYKFKNDTLTLYFKGRINYKVTESFSTIALKYISLKNVDYRILREKAYDNIDGYHSVPRRIQQNYPSNMPKPN